MANQSFKLSGSYPAARIGKVVVSGCVLFGVIIYMLSASGSAALRERAVARGEGTSSFEMLADSLPPFGTILAVAVVVALVCGLALSLAAWIDGPRDR